MNSSSSHGLSLHLTFIELVCLNLEAYANGEMILIFAGEKNHSPIYKYY